MYFMYIGIFHLLVTPQKGMQSFLLAGIHSVHFKSLQLKLRKDVLRNDVHGFVRHFGFIYGYLGVISWIPP